MLSAVKKKLVASCDIITLTLLFTDHVNFLYTIEFLYSFE